MEKNPINTEDQERMTMDALLEYVEKYGLTDLAREALAKEARKKGQDEEAAPSGGPRGSLEAG